MENTQKDWNEFKSNDSWSIFKIMSEFVEGYDRMAKIGPCVSIFGSARTKEDNPYYQLGVDIADKLARAGYGIITGGGPGLMEAANKGAQQAKGKSVGLNIDLPFEQNQIILSPVLRAHWSYHSSYAHPLAMQNHIRQQHRHRPCVLPDD